MTTHRARPAEERDRDALIRMTISLWPEAVDEAVDIVDGWLRGDEPSGLFVADDVAGAAIGFVWVRERGYAEGCDTSPVAFVEGWYVDDAHRRRGVGGALVDAVKQWAREAGHTELASDTQLWNDGSIAAHTALGFHEVERLVAFAMKL